MGECPPAVVSAAELRIVPDDRAAAAGPRDVEDDGPGGGRESLMAAVHAAKLTACEQALLQARPADMPVTVALHRYAEGIITASRRWPVDLRQIQDEAVAARFDGLIDRLDAYMARAVREASCAPASPTAGHARSSPSSPTSPPTRCRS